MVGIYKITSPSGRIYVGQSLDVQKRISHYSRLYNCKGQPKLYRSLLKYGASEHIFEVVEECEVDQLNVRERYWQDVYSVLGEQGLNCILTKTEDLPRVQSKETLEKRAESNRGKVRSEEAKAKMRKAANLRGPSGPRGPMSEDHKKKISEAVKLYRNKK